MRFLTSILQGEITRRFGTSSHKNIGEIPGITTPHIMTRHAGILDVDVNLHVNNASLLLLAEFSRWNMSAMTGLLTPAVKNRWMFLIGSQAVRYRHEIKFMEKFDIRTQVIAYDEKGWFWFHHRFFIADKNKGNTTDHHNNVLAAHVLSRILVKNMKTRKTVLPTELLKTIGASNTIPLVDATLLSSSPSQIFHQEEIQAFLKWDDVVKRASEDSKSVQVKVNS
jgi:acyl-CoA thioesterase FadM